MQAVRVQVHGDVAIPAGVRVPVERAALAAGATTA
jgi:hypothetical protein